MVGSETGEMMEPETKYCRDCKWFRLPWYERLVCVDTSLHPAPSLLHVMKSLVDVHFVFR